MRTFIAITLAFFSAAYTTFAIAPNVANNAAASWRFESPAEISSAHALVFLATCVLALLVGWGAGWVLGYPFRHRNES